MRCCRRKIPWDFLQRRLIKLCGRYSAIVAVHPYPFIIVPIILSCVLSVGWLYKKDASSAVYMFTPTDARSKTEQKSILDTFQWTDGNYVPGRSVVLTKECQVIAVAKDGQSILRPKQSEATIRLNNFVLDSIAIQDGGRNYTYNDLCLKGRKGCNTNSQIALISQLLKNRNPFLNMSYPTITYDKEQHYLASTLGGVTLHQKSRQIENATAWLMVYQLRMHSPEEFRLSSLWELEFERQLKQGYKDKDDLISFSFLHSKSLDRELAQNGAVLAPRFMIMFLLLVGFALLCTFTFVWRPSGRGETATRFPWRIDWALSRPLVALSGVVGAGMGVASAIGFLCFIPGLPFSALVQVMPFLIIAVRLDNTFLMIGALEITKRSLPPEERIVHAMSEAAVSITITVLTDVLSFACGIFTDFPSVQVFSIYTSLAIFITFVYQLTFLLGILVLSARAEEKSRHALWPCAKVRSVEEAKSLSCCVHLFCLGSVNDEFLGDSESETRVYNTPPPPYHEKCSTNCRTTLPLPVYSDWSLENNNLQKNVAAEMETTTANGAAASSTTNAPTPLSTETAVDHSHVLHRWIRDVYTPFLLKRETKIGVITLLFIFWATSAYGCSQVRQGLEPVKLLLDNSYAVSHYRYLEEYFWDYGMQMQLAFLNPGDVNDPNVQQKILNVVGEFANCRHAIGIEGVDFWMIAFDQYLKSYDSGTPMANLSKESFYDKLDYFLSLGEHSRFLVDLAPARTAPSDGNVTMIVDSAKLPIESFRLMIGMRDFSTTIEQQEAVDQFRKLADSYPEFGLVTYNILWPFVDQYEEILPNVLQEIYCSVAFMIAIALLLIPHPACAIWVTLAIASIDLGIIGFMTLWGLNMDTISMVTIIMSIGFSVDFTAHIAYAYVANIDEEPDERIRNALGTLAWPVLQGGISTLIGVVVLADLNSYMVVAFFKTVFLVIIFGLTHALVFLPVLLSLSTEPALVGWFVRRKKTPNENRTTDNNDKNKSFSTGPVKRLLRFFQFGTTAKNGQADAKREKSLDTINRRGDFVETPKIGDIDYSRTSGRIDSSELQASPSPISLQRRRSCSAANFDNEHKQEKRNQKAGPRSASLSDTQCDKRM